MLCDKPIINRKRAVNEIYFLAKAFDQLDGYAWFKILRWLKNIYRLPVTTFKILAVVLS